MQDGTYTPRYSFTLIVLSSGTHFLPAGRGKTLPSPKPKNCVSLSFPVLLVWRTSGRKKREPTHNQIGRRSWGKERSQKRWTTSRIWRNLCTRGFIHENCIQRSRSAPAGNFRKSNLLFLLVLRILGPLNIPTRLFLLL